MSQTLKVIAQLHVQGNQIEAALLAFQKLLPQVRQEQGCISYVLLQNVAQPTHFTFVEEWADEVALANHMNAEPLTSAFAVLMPMLVAEPNLQTCVEI
ncbi:MAG: putative quinol monooxygenase [Formosimonas sp.]